MKWFWESRFFQCFLAGFPACIVFAAIYVVCFRCFNFYWASLLASLIESVVFFPLMFLQDRKPGSDNYNEIKRLTFRYFAEFGWVAMLNWSLLRPYSLHWATLLIFRNSIAPLAILAGSMVGKFSSDLVCWALVDLQNRLFNSAYFKKFLAFAGRTPA